MDTPETGSNGRFRILSLDGGGIRGAFTAAFLAEVERQVKKPIGEFFDLFAGTSTGAIVAAGLALGRPAELLEELYREKGPRIFARPSRQRLSIRRRAALKLVHWAFPNLSIDDTSLFYSRYDSEELREALDSTLGTSTFEDLQRRLLIPAVDLTQGKVVVFKSPHLPGLFRDRSISVASAVLASTAAPTYFPHATIRTGSAYCDGGLWANNPSVIAYSEAVAIRSQCTREIDPIFGLDQVQVLSIGTGDHPYHADPPGTKAGLLWWGQRLYDIASASHSQGVHFQSRYLLGPRYTRIDFTVPGRGWDLDAVHHLDQLLHLGREKAAQEYVAIQQQFLGSTAPGPEWFPPQ